MKILSLNISGFGCFSNQQFDFDPQLNALCRPNGYGKSTLAAFIKVMFYGLDGITKNDARDNEYELYRPRGGGVFGGSLVFEQDGKRLRIERTFTAPRRNGSTFSLYDDVTNKPYSGYDSNLGEQLFGIDCQGFMRSIYLPQRGNTKGVNDSITARLTTLLEQGEGEGSVDAALTILDDRRRRFRLKKGEGGTLATAEKRLRLLRSQREVSRESAERVTLCKTQIERLKGRIEAQKRTLAQLTDKIPRATSQAQSIKAAQELEKATLQRTQITQEIEAIKVQFNGIEPSAQKAENLRFLQQSVEELKGKKQQLSACIDDKKSALSRRFSTTMIALVALFAIAVIAGIAVISRNLALGIACFAFGACFAVVALWLYARQAKSLNKNDATQLNIVTAELATKSEKLTAELCSVQATDAAQYSVAAQRYTDLTAATQAISARIAELSLQINPDVSLDKQLSVEQLTAEQSRLIEEKSATERQLATLENQLATYTEQAEKLPELDREIEETQEQYELDSEQLTAVLYAMQYITQARENLRASYLPLMQQSFSEYVTLLGANGDFKLDSELKVRYLLCGATVGEEYMSEGYADLTDFCCRLALCAALTQDRAGLLVLDDPFVNLDDAYLPAALSLLKQLSKRYQIVYLTCHSSRMPINN